MKYQKYAPKNLDLDLVDSNNQFETLVQSASKKIQCSLCDQDQNLLTFQQKILHNRYFEQFNFYFAKPINEILANVVNDQVILFKDFLFYNDDNEYLKRFYRQDEVMPRMQILSDFYTNQYKETRPNLCIVEPHKLVLKRNQKLAKIFLQRFSGAQQSSEQASPQPQVKQKVIQKKILPDRLFSANYTDTITSQSEDQQKLTIHNYKRQVERLPTISYESQSHDIFNQTNSRSNNTKKTLTLQPQFELEVVKLADKEEKMFQHEEDQKIENAIEQFNNIAKKVIKQTQNLMNKTKDEIQKEIQIIANFKRDSSSQKIIDNIVSQRSLINNLPETNIRKLQVPPDISKNYLDHNLQSSQSPKIVQLTNPKVPQLKFTQSSKDIGLNKAATKRQATNKMDQKLQQSSSQSTLAIKSLVFQKFYKKISQKQNPADIVQQAQLKQKTTISDEVLLKIYRQQIKKQTSTNLQTKSEQSQSPNQLRQKKNNVPLPPNRDSHSSEASTLMIKNQYLSSTSYRGPITQGRPAENSSQFERANQKNKVYLKQSTSNPALKYYEKKSNFSQSTLSPSTTQLIQHRKKENFNQTSTFNHSNYSSQKNVNKSKNQESSKQEQPTVKNVCSPSLLLRSLSSNPSVTQSPTRRLEIKFNLNKLINKQENDIKSKPSPEGYWTQRQGDQQINNNEQQSYATERNKDIKIDLSPLQQKLIKQKLLKKWEENKFQKYFQHFKNHKGHIKRM